MDGFTKVEDGMPDPYASQELATRRREAIRDVLGLMGCHCLKSSACEHVDGIVRLGAVLSETTIHTVRAAIRALPRPLAMREIDEALAAFITLPLLSANPEHTRERR